MKLDPHQFLIKVLKKKLAYFKEKNPRFSLRAFAKKVDINPAALSEILNGKRQVSPAKAKKMLKLLQTDESILKQLDQLHDPNLGIAALSKKKSESIELVLDTQNHHLVSDWRYSALFALIKIPQFKNDPAWIAEKLNLEVKDVKIILKDLKKLNLIHLDPDSGLLKAKRIVFRTSEELPSSIGKNVKTEALRSGIKSIESENAGEYGFTSVGGYNPERLHEAYPIIEDFIKRLSIYLSEGENNTDIFQLIVQIYPRTKI